MKHDEAEQLHIAVQHNEIDTVRRIVNNVNANSVLGGYAPLHWAAQEGYLEMAELLIDAGADLNVRDDCGFSPLHKAVGENDTNMAKLLIAKGADVNSYDEINGTPLFTACAHNRLSISELLLSSGADVNVCDKYGNSPIVYAVIRGHYDIVKQLIRYHANIDVKGIDVDEDDKMELKLTEIAQNHKHKDVYDLLVKNVNKG